MADKVLEEKKRWEKDLDWTKKDLWWPPSSEIEDFRGIKREGKRRRGRKVKNSEGAVGWRRTVEINRVWEIRSWAFGGRKTENFEGRRGKRIQGKGICVKIK